MPSIPLPPGPPAARILWAHAGFEAPSRSEMLTKYKPLADCPPSDHGRGNVAAYGCRFHGILGLFRWAPTLVPERCTTARSLDVVARLPLTCRPFRRAHCRKTRCHPRWILASVPVLSAAAGLQVRGWLPRCSCRHSGITVAAPPSASRPRVRGYKRLNRPRCRAVPHPPPPSRSAACRVGSIVCPCGRRARRPHLTRIPRACHGGIPAARHRQGMGIPATDSSSHPVTASRSMSSATGNGSACDRTSI